MTEQDLIHKIEWVNKRCSLKGEPLTQIQIELLKFVFADTVVNKNFDLTDVSGQLLCDTCKTDVAVYNTNIGKYCRSCKPF